MSESLQGSQWDTLMSVLINGQRYIPLENYKFQNEVTTLDFIGTNPNVRTTLSDWLSRLNNVRPRSSDLSLEFRNQGNALFNDKSGSNEDVIAEYYTQAIYSAPENSEELALAHANRAAIFMKSFFEEEAYFDCEMAIKFNYPQNKLYKLLQRKLSAAFQLNRRVLICDTIEQMESLISQGNFSEAVKSKLKNDKQSLKSYIDTNLLRKDIQLEDEVTNKKLIEKENQMLGRFILAGEPIQQNQPILKEKAFAFIPVCNDYRPNSISYHCQMCAKTNCQPFPCYKCARASYCSPECLTNHQFIHKYECMGYQKDLWQQIGIAHLAFRSFLAGFNETIDKVGNLKSLKPQALIDKMILIAKDDIDFKYGEVLRLVTNFDKMETQDVISYALTAKLLVTYLDEHTNFFNNLPKGCLNIMSTKEDWIAWTGGLIMKHLGQLVSNGHAISEMEIVQPSILGDTCMYGKTSVIVGDLHITMSSTRVFTAIFPKISLLNHSCDPNIWNRFTGPYLTVYASRDIQHNEEVFNCYGPHYKLMDKEERQSALQQQYCFRCECKRCKSGDDIVNRFLACVCNNRSCQSPLQMEKTHRYWWMDEELSQFTEDLICSKCKAKFPIDGDYFKEFMSNDVYLAPKLRSNENTEKLIEMYDNASKYLGKHHEFLQRMGQVILHAGAPVDDRKLLKKIAEIALDNLNTSRERYGVYSMEFVMASTYVLDCIAVARSYIHVIKGKDESFFKDIKNLYDLRELISAFKILSMPTRRIFLEYLNFNVVRDEDEINKDLSQLCHDLSLYETISDANETVDDDDEENDFDDGGNDEDEDDIH